MKVSANGISPDFHENKSEPSATEKQGEPEDQSIDFSPFHLKVDFKRATENNSKSYLNLKESEKISTLLEDMKNHVREALDANQEIGHLMEEGEKAALFHRSRDSFQGRLDGLKLKIEENLKQAYIAFKNYQQYYGFDGQLPTSESADLRPRAIPMALGPLEQKITNLVRFVFGNVEPLTLKTFDDARSTSPFITQVQLGLENLAFNVNRSLEEINIFSTKNIGHITNNNKALEVISEHKEFINEQTKNITAKIPLHDFPHNFLAKDLQIAKLFNI